MTRALETMQSRKVGIISLYTREKTDKFLHCFYLKEEVFCFPITTALLNWWVITCHTESHKKGYSCSYLRPYVLGTKYDFTMPLSLYKFDKVMQRRKVDFYNNLRLIKYVKVDMIPDYLSWLSHTSYNISLN